MAALISLNHLFFLKFHNMNIKPVCLTIAGSDSGGGAGIQADLKVSNYFQTFGTSVITSVTAQNPFTVSAVHPVPESVVREQIKAVISVFDVKAIKTGMLFSSSIVKVLSEEIINLNDNIPVIVDPVMIASSGANLSNDDFAESLARDLIPLAALVTPNIPEAEILLGYALTHKSDLIPAVRELSEKFSTNFILKGGHLDSDVASDFFYNGDELYEMQTSYVNTDSTHGTGCTFSMAIAVNIALGKKMIDAVVDAKAYVFQSLSNSVKVGHNAFAMGVPIKVDRSAVNVVKLG